MLGVIGHLDDTLVKDLDDTLYGGSKLEGGHVLPMLPVDSTTVFFSDVGKSPLSVEDGLYKVVGEQGLVKGEIPTFSSIEDDIGRRRELHVCMVMHILSIWMDLTTQRDPCCIGVHA